MNDCDIPVLKTIGNLRIYGDAVPLVLRKHVSQEQWTAFVQKLNNYPRTHFNWTEIAHLLFLCVVLVVLSCIFVYFVHNVFALLAAASVSFTVYAYSSYNLVAIQHDRPNMKHLATQCNEMNKTKEMASSTAEVVLNESGRVVIRFQSE